MIDLSSLALHPLLRPLLAMGSAIIVGLVIAQIYRLTHRGINYERSFPSTLVLLSPIVAVVMLFIQGNLIMSLGLVGSLSIIRFRTAIKDSRDLVYLFWTIASGLGCGTGNWAVVGVSTVVMGSTVCILHLFQYGKSTHAEFVLVVGGQSPCDLERLGETVSGHASRVKVRSHEVDGPTWETVFEISFASPGGDVLDGMIRTVQEVEGVERVSLLAPQLALPM